MLYARAEIMLDVGRNLLECMIGHVMMLMNLKYTVLAGKVIP